MPVLIKYPVHSEIIIFHFHSNWKEFDRGDSFSFDLKPKGILFGSTLKGIIYLVICLQYSNYFTGNSSECINLLPSVRIIRNRQQYCAVSYGAYVYRDWAYLYIHSGVHICLCIICVYICMCITCIFVYSDAHICV